MSLEIPATPPAFTTPDWSSHGEKVPCPLCDYDLRGLHDPRCPECGYQFHWPDLLDPTRRLHKFVFEHYPRRNSWSFAKTTWATTFRPKKFWSSLLPSQPSVPRRLVLYWLLHAAVFVAFFVAFYIWGCRQTYQLNASQRAWALKHQPYTTAADLERYWPLPPQPAFFGWVFEVMPAVRVLLGWIVILLLWPWLTTLVLMVYRISMRQAKLRPIHVLRCTIYSTATTALLAGAITFFSLILAMWWFPQYWTFEHEDLAGRLGLAAIWIALTYRLARAYRHYLRFEQSMLSVLLSQVIVVLVFAQLMIVLFRFGHLKEMLLIR
jgi:hypothetical protein